MLPEGPDSISFYNAKVKTEQKVTWCGGEGLMSPGRWGFREHVIRTPKITLPTLERQRRTVAAEGNTESPRVSGCLLPTPES